MTKVVNGLHVATLAEFTQHLAATTKLTLVEFGGPSCAPCKTLEPLLAALANENPELVTVFKVDAEADADFALEYAVRGLPTMLILRGNEQRERLVGAKSKDALLKLLRRHQ